MNLNYNDTFFSLNEKHLMNSTISYINANFKKSKKISLNKLNPKPFVIKKKKKFLKQNKPNLQYLLKYSYQQSSSYIKNNQANNQIQKFQHLHQTQNQFKTKFIKLLSSSENQNYQNYLLNFLDNCIVSQKNSKLTQLQYKYFERQYKKTDYEYIQELFGKQHKKYLYYRNKIDQKLFFKLNQQQMNKFSEQIVLFIEQINKLRYNKNCNHLNFISIMKSLKVKSQKFLIFHLILQTIFAKYIEYSGHPKQAIQNWRNFIDYCFKNQLQIQMIYGIKNIGRIKKKNKQFKKSLAMYFKILQLSWKHKLHQQELKAYNQISQLYVHLDQHSYAKFFQYLYQDGLTLQHTDNNFIKFFIQKLNYQLKTFFSSQTHNNFYLINVDVSILYKDFLSTHNLEQEHFSHLNKINTKEYIAYLRKTNNLSFNYMNSFIKGPIRTIIGQKQYKINNMKQAQQLNFRTNKAFVSLNKLKMPILLTHYSSHFNLNVYFDDNWSGQLIGIENCYQNWKTLMLLAISLVKQYFYIKQKI